ncbi:M14 family metallopeptidase [Streptomyces olivoverticillatus]
MRRRAGTVLAAASLFLGGLAAAPYTHAQPRPDGPAGADSAALSVWTAQVTAEQIPILLKAGADGHELTKRPADGKAAPVELYLTGDQARELRGQGIALTEKRLPERTRKRLAAAGDGVFRPYSGKNGLKQEITDTARSHPGLAKAVAIGKTVRGQDILAVKIGKDAARTPDGAKPAVLYMSNQHAREWITPEMTRRLMHHYLDRYGKDERITKIMDRTELWFVLSANPDGYDFTFESPASWLWRKNLRDNNGDGKITPRRRRRPQPQLPLQVGLRQRGFVRPARLRDLPRARARLRARDARPGRLRKAPPLHLRRQLPLGRRAPALRRRLAGGHPHPRRRPLPGAGSAPPEKSAIPGYRPQLSSELYTTNGEADGHAANVNGTMMFTPEMSTCETASRVDPNDRWNPADCPSSFNFPDDEKLIQGEFTKNLPFALSVAETAAHADRPSSSVGLSAPDFTPDVFTASYARGGKQAVAVTARKSVRDKRLNYTVDGGRTHTEQLRAWDGGDRYGGEDNLRFDRYRATVEDARPGATVRVWFTGRTREGKPTASEPFTFTVAERPRGADTLVISDEGGTTADLALRRLHRGTRRQRPHRGRLGRRDPGRTACAGRALRLRHRRVELRHRPPRRRHAAGRTRLRQRRRQADRHGGVEADGESKVGDADTDDFAQYYLGAGDRTTVAAPSRFTGAGELTGVTVALTTGAGGAYRPVSDELPPDRFPQFRSAAAGDYTGKVTLRDGSAGPVHRAAAVTTRDTALLGFGLENVPDARERTALMSALLHAVRG